MLSMEKIVKLIDRDLVVDSRMLAEGFEVEHRAVKQLLRKHEEAFTRAGLVAFQMSRTKNGREESFCYLNERQSILLVTLMRNSDIVVAFKEKLVNDFLNTRKALLEALTRKQNQEWLDSRSKGKVQRRQTTDTIKRFVDYAIDQGSKNASRYYGNISKMENASLFFVEQKFPNLRDILAGNQLITISAADQIVENAIIEGMEKGMFYKDIFKLCKTRVESFSLLIPKTSVPLMIERI